MTTSITYRLIKKLKEDISSSYIIGFIYKLLGFFIGKIKESFIIGNFFKVKNRVKIKTNQKNNFIINGVQWIFTKLNDFYCNSLKGSFTIKLLKSIFNLDVDIVFAYFTLLIFSVLNFKVLSDLFNYNTQFIIITVTILVDSLVLLSFLFSKENKSFTFNLINKYKKVLIEDKFSHYKLLLTIALAGIIFLMSFSMNFYKIIALLVGIMVLYFILRYYKIGMYLLAISIPFLPDQITIIILLIAVFSGFIHWIIKEDFKVNINGYNNVFVLMLIVFSINTLLSVNISGSIRDLVINGLSILMIIHMINGINNKKDIYMLIDFIIGVGFITAFYAFYQYFSGEPMGSGWVDPSSNISIRVFSSFENPNLYAEYLIMIIPLTFARLISVDKRKKVLYAIVGITQLLVLLLTFSRGGWLGLVFSTGLFILLLKRDLIIKLIPVGLVGLFFLPSSIMMRIKSIGNLSDSSNFYRLQIWQNSINIIKDFFFTGVGLGFESFRTISGLYIKDFSPYHAHNTFLELTIEIGVLGLFLFIWLLVKLLKDVKSQSLSKDKVYTVALFSSIAGLFVHGIAEHILYNPKIIFQFWLIIGLLITLNVKFMKVRENNEYINDN